MGFRRSWVEMIVSCVALAGCGSHSLDIGSNDAGSAGTVDSESMSLPLGPSPDASGDTRQVWIGHLVDKQFPDGSNALTLTIDFAPGGQVTGTLLLGDGALLQPPTDPNVGYPPGNQGIVSLVEGFRYTILDGGFSGAHLTFQISEYEVWTQWCALQTPYLIWQGSDSGPPESMGPDVYECLPQDGGVEFGPTGCNMWNRADGALTPIDCGKLKFCGGPGPEVCQCSASGCRAFPSAGPVASLALVLARTTADGTMSGEFGDDKVHFTRSQ
jgi:hypothetical protein